MSAWQSGFISWVSLLYTYSVSIKVICEFFKLISSRNGGWGQDTAKGTILIGRLPREFSQIWIEYKLPRDLVKVEILI